MPNLKYNYPHRDLFEQRLVETGLTPRSAQTYATGVLSIDRYNHGPASKKWKLVMEDLPIPSSYIETKKGKYKKSNKQVEEVSQEPVEASTDSSPKTEIWTARDLIGKLLEEKFCMHELNKTVTALHTLRYLSKDQKIDYLIRYLIVEHY